MKDVLKIRKAAELHRKAADIMDNMANILEDETISNEEKEIRYKKTIAELIVIQLEINDI